MTRRNGDSVQTATDDQLRDAARFALHNLDAGRPTAAVRDLLPALELAPRSIPARRIHVVLKRAVELLGAERYSDARALLDRVAGEDVTKSSTLASVYGRTLCGADCRSQAEGDSA